MKIIERSIQNNRYCFLENAKKEGSLSGAELETLFSWYDWLNSHIGLPLDLIVYLKTSPEVAYERLKKRGRKEEAGVPLEFLQVRQMVILEKQLIFNLYLKSLHQSYEDWLINKTSGPLPAPVLIMDADQGIDNMIRTYETYKEEIRGRKPYIAPSSNLRSGAIKSLN